MAFTVFADGARACLEWNWNGAIVTICIHWEKTSPTEADFIALADELGFRWETNLRPRQTEDITFNKVTVYDLSAEDAPVYENTDESGLSGDILVDGTPNNTAALITHKTNTRGRSGRGRTYFPGVPESSVVDGLLEAGYLANLVTNWTSFINNIQTVTGWGFVVAQRFDNGVQLTNGIMRPVTTEVFRANLGTQRRRQAG